MQTSLKIDFHGAEPNEVLRRVIGERQARLEHFFERLIACHVTVKAPGEHHRTGGLYEVHIHVTLPDGAEVNVGRATHSDERQSDPVFAIDDAFRRARRQLQDHVHRLQDQVKASEHDVRVEGSS